MKFSCPDGPNLLPSNMIHIWLKIIHKYHWINFVRRNNALTKASVDLQIRKCYYSGTTSVSVSVFVWILVEISMDYNCQRVREYEQKVSLLLQSLPERVTGGRSHNSLAAKSKKASRKWFWWQNLLQAAIHAKSYLQRMGHMVWVDGGISFVV